MIVDDSFMVRQQVARALDDAVREFANGAAGAFKRAALAEGVVLTTGLPRSVRAADLSRRPSGLVREFAAAVEGSSVRIGLRLAVIPRALERVNPANLREGMVVGHDLFGDGGALLVRAVQRGSLWRARSSPIPISGPRTC
jgi:hypothetical protein